MSNRKAAQDFILKYIEKIFPGKINKNKYIALFESMSDIEFDKFMRDLESKERFLVGYVPNLSEVKITVENNMKIAGELNYDFFQKLIIGPKKDELAYITPIKYLVVDLPIKRQSQHLQKKISIPEHNLTIDTMTYQPTGASKGAKISYNELQVLTGMNMNSSVLELIKYRGGDKGGYNALNAMITRYGTANLKTLEQYSTGVESTKTLKTFLTAMHLRNTL